MRKISTRGALAALVIATSGFALTACTSPVQSSSSAQGHGSRVELYSSVADLAADSDLIVVATVTGQTTAADIDAATDFTLSTVTIDEVKKGDGVEAGTSLIVRQLGSAEQGTPAPLLTDETTYLLYLTPSGLDGELASQYYVTGGSAGLYVASDTASRSADPEAVTFEQLQPEEGESLPAELTAEDANG